MLVFFAVYSCTQPLGDISIPALIFGALVLHHGRFATPVLKTVLT